jgi:subfamily B ATP-binding cassette protein MsbA
MLVLDGGDAAIKGEVFLGFIIVFSQLMRPIQGISQGMSNLNQAFASLDRINNILNTDEKIYERENPIQISEINEGVTYENVTFRYRDENVINNVSFKIPAGKMIALVGESGSGKSTLADLLPRFYDVQEGAVKIDGIDIKDVSMYDLRNHIGIVSQESILFNATVKENIAFGMQDADEEEIIQAAKIANAHDFIMELEHGYDTNIGERGNKLSGGQKQRVSIARAILKNPSILILDEATSALDTESERLAQDALEHLMQNRTSLVIAHRLSTIQKADEILVLSKGEIKERGTHDALMQRNGIYAKLSSMQGINA